MWNTRSTFPLPPAPARNKALNKRKALAGSSGGGLAFFIPALFLFRSAPASKTFTNLRPHPARFRPSRTSALSLPARSGARSPLAAVAAASPSFSPYPTRSCLGSPLPSRPCTSAPALHSRPGPPLPPRPSAPAPALHSRLGPPLPPRPAAPALALRSRLGPPLPPRPPTPAPAIHPRFTCTFLPKCSTWNIWGAFLSLENSERSFAFVGMKFNLQGKNVPRGTFFPCKQALELLPENHYIL